MVIRGTRNLPARLTPQPWVKSRKLKVSGLRLPSKHLLSRHAKRPNRIGPVFSGKCAHGSHRAPAPGPLCPFPGSPMRRSLEDLREVKGERALMKLIGREQVPDADRVGDWLRRMGDPGKGQRGPGAGAR